MADGLYLPEDCRVGLVLSLDHTGRLQPVYHPLGTLSLHERQGREESRGKGIGKGIFPQGKMPRLLSDNGPCYISGELKEFIKEREMEHIRGKPNHPQTQGKIKRYHRSMKNIIKLDNYYLPGELKERLEEFVDYYNNRRYHESLDNLTPATVYFGLDKKILENRKLIKRRTMLKRRKEHQIQKLKL